MPHDSEDVRCFGFAARIWNATHWFSLSQDDFVQLMGNDLAGRLQTLMAVLDELESRNPAEHSALIEAWCAGDNEFLHCSPKQALKDGRLDEVLNAARQAVMVEPEEAEDWSEFKDEWTRRLRRLKGRRQDDFTDTE
jgi:hypothetical protein